MYWDEVFTLAYHVKGFTYPIAEMRPRMRRGMLKRLIEQKKIEAAGSEKMASDIKSGAKPKK